MTGPAERPRARVDVVPDAIGDDQDFSDWDTRDWDNPNWASQTQVAQPQSERSKAVRSPVTGSQVAMGHPAPIDQHGTDWVDPNWASPDERYTADAEFGFDRDADGDDDAGDYRSERNKVFLQVGLVVGVGFLIWAAVTMLSPSTLVDTTDLPEDAATLAGRAIDPGDPATRSPLGSGGTVIVGAGDGSADGALGVDGAATTETSIAQESTTTTSEAPSASLDYQSNLELLRSASVRNNNHDGSPYANTPSASLVLENHYGPRSDYLTRAAGNPENSFPVAGGGQFRAVCEFSHFSYDDPLVFPGKPGASHLHMNFGNTDVNAFSTYDTLINSGSSTCNGQELNRTGYWVPAMFDGNGNVRVPERIVVYYKGEGRARGAAEAYPEGAAMIANYNLNTMPASEGGIGGKKLTFQCSDNFSTNTGIGGQTMPSCDGSRFGGDPGRRVVLEMSLKFPQCWNGADPTNIDNFRPPQGDWYGSNCGGDFNHTLPNLEYFVNYPLEPGENSADWFLSSDVDPTSFGATKATGGSTIHGDWWGGWHKEINQMWIDNCVNLKTSVASGCGHGYLTDGGPNGAAPLPGPALKHRPQYEGPIKVSAETLMRELCPDESRTYSRPEDAAYCAPGTGL